MKFAAKASLVGPNKAEFSTSEPTPHDYSNDTSPIEMSSGYCLTTCICVLCNSFWSNIRPMASKQRHLTMLVDQTTVALASPTTYSEGTYKTQHKRHHFQHHYHHPTIFTSSVAKWHLHLFMRHLSFFPSPLGCCGRARVSKCTRSKDDRTMFKCYHP